MTPLSSIRRRARSGVQVAAVAAMFFVIVISVAIGYYAGLGNAQSQPASDSTPTFNLPITSSSAQTNQSSTMTDPASTVFSTMYVTTTVTNTGAVYTLTVTEYYSNGTRTVVVTTTDYTNSNATTTVLVTTVSTITSNNTITVTPLSQPPPPPPPPKHNH